MRPPSLRVTCPLIWLLIAAPALGGEEIVEVRASASAALARAGDGAAGAGQTAQIALRSTEMMLISPSR